MKFFDHGLGRAKFAVRLYQPGKHYPDWRRRRRNLRTIGLFFTAACHLKAPFCRTPRVPVVSDQDLLSQPALKMQQNRIGVCEAVHMGRLNLMEICHDLQSVSVKHPHAAARGFDHPGAFPQGQGLGNGFAGGTDKFGQFRLRQRQDGQLP